MPLDMPATKTSCSPFKCRLELPNELYRVLHQLIWLCHALHGSLACSLYYCCREIRHRGQLLPFHGCFVAYLVICHGHGVLEYSFEVNTV